METRDRFGIAVGLVALGFVAGLLAVPELPAELATHWNAAGEPDGTMATTMGLAVIPGVSIVFLAVFWVIPKIDPLGENIAEFRSSYDWFVVLFTGFLTVVHLGIIAFNLGYEFDFTAFVLVGGAGLLYYVGVLLGAAERNWFIGIRTPWTLSSETVWKRTHTVGSRSFKLIAVFAVVGVFFGEYAVWFVVVPTVLTAVGTVVYSYVLYDRLEDPSESVGLD